MTPFRGFLLGFLLGLFVLWGYVLYRGLSDRLETIENFLGHLTIKESSIGAPVSPNTVLKAF